MAESTLVLDPVTTPAVVRSFGLTDRGQVRARNEDNFLIAELARTLWVHETSLEQTQAHYSRSRGHIFLVADGMGGHQAGEVASALGVRTVEDYALDLLRWFSTLQATDDAAVLKDFQQAVHDADARLIDEAAQHPEFAGMGTTLTLAFATGWKVFVVHVGDSRCYLCRAGRLQQLTEDHTVATELARRGVIRPEEIATNRYRHVLTNAVGGREKGVEVEMQRHDLEPGDTLLLCSDGLTDMVSDEALAAILQASKPKHACERLVAEANLHGGRDNITAIVAHFEAAAE